MKKRTNIMGDVIQDDRDRHFEAAIEALRELVTAEQAFTADTGMRNTDPITKAMRKARKVLKTIDAERNSK